MKIDNTLKTPPKEGESEYATIENLDTNEKFSLYSQISFNVGKERIKMDGYALYEMVKDLVNNTTPLAIIPIH